MIYGTTLLADVTEPGETASLQRVQLGSQHQSDCCPGLDHRRRDRRPRRSWPAAGSARGCGLDRRPAGSGGPGPSEPGWLGLDEVDEEDHQGVRAQRAVRVGGLGRHQRQRLPGARGGHRHRRWAASARRGSPATAWLSWYLAGHRAVRLDLGAAAAQAPGGLVAQPGGQDQQMTALGPQHAPGMLARLIDGVMAPIQRRQTPPKPRAHEDTPAGQACPVIPATPRTCRTPHSRRSRPGRSRTHRRRADQA